MMVMAMGGRVAEKLVFNESSSGAANDLQQATNMARRMVTEWGMSEAIGPMSLADGGPVFLGDGMASSKGHSDHMDKLIDEETRRILIEAEDKCAELLTTYRNGLDLIARALLEHESISGDEVYRLLNLSGANLELPGNTSLTDAAALQNGTPPPPADAVALTDENRDARVEAVLDAVKQSDTF